jgi:hypothetical protein
VYNSTLLKEDPVSKRLNDYALFGYVFAFAENCFPPNIAFNMPADIWKNNFNFFYSGKWRTAETTQKYKQQQAFKGIIELLDNDKEFEVFKDDKSFNSYSANIKATYLDSYSDTLTKVEKEKLMLSIKKDIVEFQNGSYISNSSTTQRLLLLAPQHIAFAEYVVKYIETGVSDYIIFQKTYDQISKEENISNTTKKITEAWLLIYKIAAMGRAQAAESEIDRSVKELDSLFKDNASVSGISRSYLNYGLSELGNWYSIKQDIFKLAKTNKSLDELLSNVIGLKNYK